MATKNKWIGAVAGLIGGQVAGRLLAAFLSSKSGERLLEKIDKRPLTPMEHRVLARKWSGNIGKAIGAAAATLVVAQASRDESRGQHGQAGQPGSLGVVPQKAEQGIMSIGGRNVDWVQVLQRAGEIMLAFGAIFKVIGEYLEDRQKAADETQSRAARRLV